MTIESVLVRQAEDKSKDLTVLLSPNERREQSNSTFSPETQELTNNVNCMRHITRTKPIPTPEGKERLVIVTIGSATIAINS